MIYLLHKHIGGYCLTTSTAVARYMHNGYEKCTGCEMLILLQQKEWRERFTNFITKHKLCLQKI
jgi:hypothetical protein